MDGCVSVFLSPALLLPHYCVVHTQYHQHVPCLPTYLASVLLHVKAEQLHPSPKPTKPTYLSVRQTTTSDGPAVAADLLSLFASQSTQSGVGSDEKVGRGQNGRLAPPVANQGVP
jgi:hypothetical protein